jgi:uncharacterized SAM-binding protein YcdF (DUF218 family)
VNRDLDRADALVVMAGSPGLRLPAAVRLYQEGRALKILLANDGIRSAWSQTHGRNLYEVEWAEVELLKQGIPAGVIRKLPFTASGTIHDVRHAVELARAEGLHSMLVVTSDYHTQRTLWCFKRVAGDAPLKLGIYPVVSKQPLDRSFRRLATVTVEAFKNIYYRLRYFDVGKRPMSAGIKRWSGICCG